MVAALLGGPGIVDRMNVGPEDSLPQLPSAVPGVISLEHLALSLRSVCLLLAIWRGVFSCFFPFSFSFSTLEILLKWQLVVKHSTTQPYIHAF